MRVEGFRVWRLGVVSDLSWELKKKDQRGSRGAFQENMGASGGEVGGELLREEQLQDG